MNADAVAQLYRLINVLLRTNIWRGNCQSYARLPDASPMAFCTPAWLIETGGAAASSLVRAAHRLAEQRIGADASPPPWRIAPNLPLGLRAVMIAAPLY